MNLSTNHESISYQPAVDWAEASTVWHAVDGILSYMRYLFVVRNWVSSISYLVLNGSIYVQEL